MITEEIVKIESVKFAPTRNGKDRWMITIPGAELSCFDPEAAEECNTNIGKFVNAHIEQAGKYLNLKMIEPAEKNVSSPSAKSRTAAPSSSRPAYDNNGARVGMAVNNAVALAIAGKLPMTDQDVSIMQPIARAASEIIAMSKELEKK